MRADISIVGLSPSTLGLCILAKHIGLTVCVIDPFPFLYFPTFPYLDNYLRREPISMDVLTGVENDDFHSYRLNTFLRFPTYASNPQTCEEYCSHKQYNTYIHFLVEQLKASGYVYFIEEGVSFIRSNNIVLSGGNSIRSNSVVIASRFIHRPTLPAEINIQNKAVSLDPFKDSVEDITQKTIVVWGTDEYQLITLLQLASSNNHITWIINKPYKETQYEFPSYKEWGEKSVYESYFNKELQGDKAKQGYIDAVNNWQPSITPKHKSLLDDYLREGRIKLVYRNEVSSSAVKDLVIRANYTLPIPYRHIELSDIPFYTKSLPNPNNELFPLLNPNFSDTQGIYYMDYLATYFDGPRQTSTIVCGTTANTILQDILKHNV